jgi:hypothetical protein
MRTVRMKRWLAAIVCLSLIIALVVATAMAQKKHEIAGKMTMVYPTQERLEVGDTEGHVLSFGVAEGTNECISKYKFMDGAQAVNMAYSDLVQGNGPHQGYLKLTLGEDAVFFKWEGMVTVREHPGEWHL